MSILPNFNPLSMGFSRQEYWSGLPCPPPGVKSASLTPPALAGGFFTISANWEAPLVLKGGNGMSE